MKAPAFWWRPPGAAAALLRPAAALYGAVAARRLGRAGASVGAPVICVGNVTVGGSGKTPTALALGAMLAAAGRKPGFLLRGYGGRLPGPVLVDPDRHDAAAVGDEALLLARAAPTVVSRDRPAGARLLLAGGADIVVMDDGLQNPSLAKDLSLAVFDGAVGIGNGLALPAGPLRAPLAAQWRLIDAVLVIGAGEPGDAIAAEAKRQGKPVLTARLEPDPAAAASLRGARVVAFAGIGRPEKLFATLAACGATLAATRAFADHHGFAERELAALAAEAKRAAATLVTTEKDAVRIGPWASRFGIAALPVRLVFDEPARAAALLARLT